MERPVARDAESAAHDARDGAGDAPSSTAAPTVAPTDARARPPLDAAADADAALLWVALGLAPHVGPLRLRALMRAHGGLAGIAAAADAGRLDRGAPAPSRVGPGTLRAVREALTPASLRRTEARMRAWRNRGIGLLHRDHPDYPPLLTHIDDPPALLFVRGHLPDAARAPVDLAPTVAVVGTRRATPWGQQFATRLGRDLAEAGVVVVSGLALGIDGAAHRGALDAEGGTTVAVLGSGVHRIHPPAHRGLARQVVQRGALLSEYPPDADARPGNFPRRNRIIAGLARAVIVVEAPTLSGAHHTAKHAYEGGRSLWVVPQRPDSRMGQGLFTLLADGAAPLQSATDVLEELGLRPAARHEAPNLNALQRRLLNVLQDTGGAGMDRLAAEGSAAGAVLAALTDLEVAGLIRPDGRGGWRPS